MVNFPTTTTRAVALLLLFVLLLPSHKVKSSPIQKDSTQTPSTEPKQECVVVNKIVVEGNSKTKRAIILRELNFDAGDTICIPRVVHRFNKNEQLLVNTGLFNSAKIEIRKWEGNYVDVFVLVKERWYTFPIPVFELADRNFNVWWVEYDHDFSRTVYGLKFFQENVRGRNEELKIAGLLGFTQQLELQYTIPFIDKKLQNGLQFNILYARNKEIAFHTFDDKLEFYRNNKNFIRQNFYSKLSFTHRKAIHKTHYFNLSYHNNQIDDTVATLNEHYFLDHKLHQQYFKLAYHYERDYRDFSIYPLEGSYAKIKFIKTGLALFKDINLYEIIGRYSKYWQLSRKNYLAGQFKGKLSYPNKQPYFNQQALGYRQDLVRGYEYYVVDGQHFGLLKTSLKYQLLDLKFKNIGFIPLRQFKTLPLGIYLKIFSDLGYVSDQYFYNYNGSQLSNELLVGGGVGVDIVSFYDIVLRFEYSMNRMLERGFFLHFESAL